MTIYGTLSDDFYSNLNLNTEMQLPNTRETILSFFERVQKTYPSMRNFYARDNGDFVLEEDKDQGHYRWLSLESQRICSGYMNPPDLETAAEQHRLVLELVPYMLSVSPLDCEALDYMVGFDFEYRGNQDELVAKAFSSNNAIDSMIDVPDSRVISYEPNITLALNESCRRQARLMVETRTSAYQVQRGEYGDEPISVYFTVRQYGSLETDDSYEKTLAELKEQSEELIDSYVIENVLRPMANAIIAS